jgi:hypothetical protein
MGGCGDEDGSHNTNFDSGKAIEFALRKLPHIIRFTKLQSK